MEDWELAARLGVEDTIGRYVRFADGGRSEALAALFAVDGVLTTDHDELRGRVAITEYLEGVRADLAASTTGGGRIRHHVSSLRMVVEHRDEAQATSYFLALTGSGLDHWGVYRDRLVLVDDQWLFAHRQAMVEGAAPGSWAERRRGT
jgi:SnoaL-like domain